MEHKPKKSGRPKSLIARKQTTFSLSDFQVRQFAQVEGKLKAEGVPIKRSRSETAELAIALLQDMLDSEQYKDHALGLIRQYINYEENGYKLNE